MDNRWVIVDSCWNTRNAFRDGEYIIGSKDEQYFDITPFALSLNHRADKIEERHYFNALEYISDIPEVTTTEQTSVETTTTTATTSTTQGTTTMKTDTPKEDNTLLYIVIGIISVGIIAAVIFLINARKGKD